MRDLASGVPSQAAVVSGATWWRKGPGRESSWFVNEETASRPLLNVSLGELVKGKIKYIPDGLMAGLAIFWWASQKARHWAFKPAILHNVDNWVSVVQLQDYSRFTMLNLLSRSSSLGPKIRSSGKSWQPRFSYSYRYNELCRLNWFRPGILHTKQCPVLFSP